MAPLHAEHNSSVSWLKRAFGSKSDSYNTQPYSAGVIGAAAMLLRTDIRSSGKMLQRNIKTIRSWVEEAQEGASK